MAHTSNPVPKPTRSLVLKGIQHDLGTLGFVRHGKELRLDNADLAIELGVDIVRQGMDPADHMSQVDVTFRVSLHDPRLQNLGLDLPVFWIGTGWFSRYDILGLKGKREPYLMPPGGTYEDSRLAQDMQDLGIDFFRSIAIKENFFEYLLCHPIEAGNHQIKRSLDSSRNALAMILVIADALHDEARTREAIAGLRQYAALSSEDHRSLQTLVQKFDQVGMPLKRYDNELYRSLVN